jgi:predicted permease
MLQHLRHARRSLLRSPLITAAAVITLGLGIGGATAVFSIVQAIVLRPLPFPQPDRLVRIWELTREGGRFPFSAPDYLDMADQSRTLQHIAAYDDAGATAVLADGGEPRRLTVTPVSSSFTDVLGMHPATGRMFTASEDRPGSGAGHVVLSDRIWRERFGAAPSILERAVTLDGRPFVVSGVMPAGFDFPGGTDAWIPLAADPRGERDGKSLAVIGRLAPGATLAQLRQEAREIARRTADAYPESNAGWSADAVPFSEWIVAPRVRDAVWVLFGAVTLLLLLACANVANLLVAQAESRRAEMQVRAALGASRARLVRHLLAESGMLALVGTAAGVLIAAWSVDAVRSLGSGRVPRLDELRLDGAVLAFGCLAGAASCLIFGLAPALHATRIDLRSGMDEGLRYSAGGQRLRRALLVFEVALALLLIVGAGLMANSFVRLVRVDPGFRTDGVLAMPIDLPSSRYSEAAAAGFYSSLLDRVRAIPGVTSAGATATNPFRQVGFSNNVTPEDRAAEAPPSGLVQAGWRSVTPGFFETLNIPLLSGRTFASTDDSSAERVVVITEGLARRLWPRGSAVGQRIYWGGTTGRTRTVIGVVRDIRDHDLDAVPPPILFVPYAQVQLPSMTIVVRTAAGMASVAPAMRQAARDLDPLLPPPPIDDVAASRAQSTAGPRFNLSMLAAFAAIALALAATGVYAMVAFTVSARRREIAVRMALGADGARVARLVVRNGVGLAIAGVAAGTLAAFLVTRVLSGLLYGVTPTDPLTFAGAAALLVVVAALACYIPARQASRVDPVSILRE